MSADTKRHALHEKIFSYSGLNPDNYSAQVLDSRRMQDVVSEMFLWLPKQLQILGLEGRVIDDITKIVNGEETYHITTRIWGKKPEIPTDMLYLEMAGPTSGVYGMESMFGRAPDIVTNIAHTHDVVDIIADAKAMPIKNDSVAGVYVSRLDGIDRITKDAESVRNGAIGEAHRIVAPDGKFIWIAGTPTDFEVIIQQGFTPEYIEAKYSICECNDTYTNPNLRFNGVFSKKSLNKKV